MTQTSAYPESLKSALKLMQKGIRAERYLVCWRGMDHKLRVVSAQGMDEKALFVSEALSVSLLEGVASSGEACWSDQDQPLEGSLTFMLSGIKSYICVPVKFPGRAETGLLYVDDRKTVAPHPVKSCPNPRPPPEPPKPGQWEPFSCPLPSRSASFAACPPLSNPESPCCTDCTPWVKAENLRCSRNSAMPSTAIF